MLSIKKIASLFIASALLVTMMFSDTVTPLMITSYAEEETQPQTVPYIKYTITEAELEAAGVAWQGSTNAQVFVEMTKGGPDSKVNASISLGPDENGAPIGKTSSKYLGGSNVNSGNAIQDNLIGAAGTGIYVFPTVYLNKTLKEDGDWDESYESEITITVRIDTADTDCELLGIKFSNGAVYAVSEGFDPDKVVTESTTFDKVEADARGLLKLTIDYCDGMTSDKYQSESWDALIAELSKAKAVYEKENEADSVYKDARAALIKVKANMLFKDTGTAETPLPFRDLTTEEIVFEMGVGTNLGNTMDGHSGFVPNETSWQSVVTTKEYIKALHDAGYNTLRIPVTWGRMISSADEGYILNEKWLNRVQEIVDYCISLDMYAIINVHHDGAEQSGWLRVAAEDIDPVYEKFEFVWRNIAERFKDYDEHLIFESMNEITCMEGDAKNSQAAVDYDTPIIVNFNQLFVNVVRSTGSNNEKRWLAAVAHYANSGNHKEFVLPTDSYNESPRIMFAAHIYKANTNKTWTYEEVYQVVNGLKMMANKFDVPMYLGEYGTRTYELEGTASGYNDVARAYFSEVVHRACQTAGVVPVVWDQGYGSKGKYETGLFSYWDRVDCVPLFKTIVDAMMRGTYLPNSELNDSYDYTDVVEDPEIIPITGMTLNAESAEIELGDNYVITAETTPANSNDVVLWSTDDESVATVTRGIVRGRGIGITTIRAYTQNGEVKKEFKITVKPKTSDTPVTEILGTDSVYITTGTSKLLDVYTEAEGIDGYLTYKSSDSTIASVSPTGRVIGASNGTAFITVTAASGVTKTVKVIVSDTNSRNEMNVALHVLYNDSSKNYYGCETGETVKISKDGQYTVTFNLDEDLSAEGKSAGITEINKLTAIYIKDIDVTSGKNEKSYISDADIRYDSVKLNGIELDILNSGFASGMTNTTFDTGGPINAWHSSPLVSGYKSSDHVATFTDIKDVKTVEVTFTVKDMQFILVRTDKNNEASGLAYESGDTIDIDAVGDIREIKVKVEPADANATVTFVPSDAGVLFVDSKAVTLDENGYAVINVTALKVGTTTLTAYTESGITAVCTVNIINEEPSLNIGVIIAVIAAVLVVAAGVVAAIIAGKKKSK